MDVSSEREKIDVLSDSMDKTFEKQQATEEEIRDVAAQFKEVLEGLKDEK